MAKRAYVGVISEVPIYVDGQVKITPTNIADYFTVTNSTYHFVGDYDGVFTSNNGGVDSSTAKTTLTALKDMDISFDYSYSSEGSYDKFTLTVAGTKIENAVSGSTTNKSYQGTITTGQTIIFQYSKDSSTNYYDDECTFSNMMVSGKVPSGEYETKSVARRIKKGYIGAKNFTQRDLPNGYTQVDYIESSGTQYIDTGFNPKYNTRVVMDISKFGVSGFIFGARDTSSTSSPNQFCLYRNATTTFRSDYFGTNKSLSITKTTPRTIIDKNAHNVELFGNTITNTEVSSGECSYPLYIFTLNNAGKTNGLIACKLHSCQIYDGDVLVRDYVPCVSPDDEAGLYDLVNGVFYQNAGTESFSVGETYEIATRKIKKGYIGIDGIARPFWGANSGEISYYGVAEPLSTARYYLAATSVGNYALFGGGYGSNSVDAYDKELTRTTPTPLSAARYQLAATSVGNYALFGGGYGSNSVNAYDENLTRTNPTVLSTARGRLAATSVGNYALFGGGYSSSDVVDAYDENLTRTNPTVLSTARYYLAAASIGNYALFGGGYSASNVVDAYDKELTRTTPTPLSAARYQLAATSIDNYALFGGGYTGSVYSAAVNAYNFELTRTNATSLKTARQELAATSVDNYALFGGGYNGSALNIVDSYSSELTRTNPTVLSTARYYLAAASIGNYALFGGGYSASNVVDAYTTI